MAGLALVFPVASPASVPLPPGQIVVTDYGTYDTGSGRVISVDPFTGKERKLSANDQAVNAGSQLFENPYAVALASSGRLVIVDDSAFGGGGVISVDPATGKQTKVSGNDMPVNGTSMFFDLPDDLVLSDDRILVATSDGFGSGCGGSGCGGVISVDPATGKETELSSNDLPVNASNQLYVDPYGIAVLGNRIVVSDYNAFSSPSGGLIAVDPSTGAESKLSANDMPVNNSSKLFSVPVDITVARDGSILVADYTAFGGTGGVISVDPATGKETKLSANDMPVNDSSKFFVNPNGIAVAADGQILVSDRDAFGGSGGLIGVDPATGKQTRISSNAMAVNDSSQLFGAPTGMMIVPGIPANCQGRRATIVGTGGPDKLKGTGRPDVIAGLGGNDRIRGLAGGDRLCGGKGRDRLLGGGGRDRLFGATGRDRCVGGPKRDTARGCEVERSI